MSPVRMQDELGGGEDAPPPAAKRGSALGRTLALIVFVILVIAAALAGAGLGAAYAYRQIGQSGHQGATQNPGGEP